MKGSARRALLAAIAFWALWLAAGIGVVADAAPRHRWDGRIERFEHRDIHHWRAGNWHHVRHDGHLGWWWVVGGLWYPYPAPVYPYPNPYRPPAVVVAPQTAPPVWYYCDSAQAYYPYVATCPSGWRSVPATPRDLAPEPAAQ